MDQAREETARRAALDFAERMADFWDGQLGPRLTGVYLIGSLAHGGFSSRYSDIDMGLLAENGLTAAELARMRDTAAALAPAQAAKLSLFWSDPGFSIGRFPPLDRVDFLDHGIALIERRRVRPERPPLAGIRAYLRGAPFEGWAQSAQHFAALAALEPNHHKPYLRCLLYPARLIYSWKTGAMASNDVAVAFLHENAPAELDIGLIERALDCRRTARDPDLIFPARATLLRQLAAGARLLAKAG